MLGPTPRGARFVTPSTLQHDSSHPAPVCAHCLRFIFLCRYVWGATNAVSAILNGGVFADDVAH